jgi:hypothetical protein
MKKVYEGLDPLMVGLIKNILENEGISCITRNEYLASAAGEIPPSECWLEIWVENDLQYDDAEKIIKTVLSDDLPSGPEWVCPNCGEENENQFSECWNCGREKP